MGTISVKPPSNVSINDIDQPVADEPEEASAVPLISSLSTDPPSQEITEIQPERDVEVAGPLAAATSLSTTLERLALDIRTGAAGLREELERSKGELGLLGGTVAALAIRAREMSDQGVSGMPCFRVSVRFY